MSVASRRQFLQGVAAGTALGVGPVVAVEPLRRAGRSKLRLSIAAYSYRQYLDLKQKRPALDLDGFIDLAADLGVDAVELTAYYFAKTTPEYLASLKGHCTRLGLDISGTAVGNNFCTPDADKLKQQLAYVRAWVEHTARLGGKTVRRCR